MKNFIHPFMWKMTAVLVFLLFASSLIFITSCKKNSSLEDNESIFLNLTPSESNTLIQDNAGNSNFIIIDIRTPAEYNRGYIAFALNIDSYSNDFNSRLQALDKKKTYLIYCSSGGRSGTTFNSMKNIGFSEVYNLLGGITRWISEGYPVIVPD